MKAYSAVKSTALVFNNKEHGTNLMIGQTRKDMVESDTDDFLLDTQKT